MRNTTQIAPAGVALWGTLNAATAAVLPALPSVRISSVDASHDSVTLTYAPVEGALDYRVYDATHPERVKYAGLVHKFDPMPANPAAIILDKVLRLSGLKQPQAPRTEPALAIEWNGIEPGHTIQLVVEAVDRLGPAPAPSVKWSNGFVPPGANATMTCHGELAVNGQGEPNARPLVLARSAPVSVQGSGNLRLPSTLLASQVFLDTFPDTMQAQLRLTASDPARGSASYQLGRWDVQISGADLSRSGPFIAGRHFMDVLADDSANGGRAALAMSPGQSANFSDGRVLHLTMEVDSHVDNRRWVGFALAPASDPATDFYAVEHTFNRTHTGLSIGLTPFGVRIEQFFGTGAQGSPQRQVLATGGASYGGDGARGRRGDGRALDRRVRLDVFVSATRVAVYAGGLLLEDRRLARPLPFTIAKVYFTHFVHDAQKGSEELRRFRPHEAYWIRTVPRSDERHWDNMGFEVLPADTLWNSLNQRASSPAATGLAVGGVE